MDKIIPFKKDIIFQTNLSEVTSISLEHNLNTVGDNEISGNFMVSGEYKIADTSQNVETFSYDLPFHIHLDDKYILDHVEIDIDDFYYEIINDSVLSVNIDVLVTKLEERLVEEEVRKEDVIEVMEEEETKNIDVITPLQIEEEETPRCIEEEEETSNTIFSNMDSFGETYKSYKIYIVRDGDSIETILEKYGVSKEQLDEYNDLKEIKSGDKIIIPS